MLVQGSALCATSGGMHVGIATDRLLRAIPLPRFKQHSPLLLACASRYGLPSAVRGLTSGQTAETVCCSAACSRYRPMANCGGVEFAKSGRLHPFWRARVRRCLDMKAVCTLPGSRKVTEGTITGARAGYKLHEASDGGLFDPSEECWPCRGCTGSAMAAACRAPCAKDAASVSHKLPVGKGQGRFSEMLNMSCRNTERGTVGPCLGRT